MHETFLPSFSYRISSSILGNGFPLACYLFGTYKLAQATNSDFFISYSFGICFCRLYVGSYHRGLTYTIISKTFLTININPLKIQYMNSELKLKLHTLNENAVSKLKAMSVEDFDMIRTTTSRLLW